MRMGKSLTQVGLYSMEREGSKLGRTVKQERLAMLFNERRIIGRSRAIEAGMEYVGVERLGMKRRRPQNTTSLPR